MRAQIFLPCDAKIRFLASATLLIFSSSLIGCSDFDRVKAGARVSPVIGRSTAAYGAGGLPILRDKNNMNTNVIDLRVTYAMPVDLDTLRFPDQNKPTDKTAYELAVKDEVMRNRLQDYIQLVSDQVCIVHKSDILAVASTFNASLSGLTSILGGLSGIFTGATAARALGGSAGITNAIREDVNQNVYYNNFASAIIRQIDLQRKKKLQDIQPKRSQSITEYSVDAAIVDISDYHNLCSFSEAIAALADETKRPSSANELQGRLDALQAQYTKNKDLIDGNPPQKTKDILQRANDSIAHMMDSIVLQIGLVQGATVTPAPLPPAPAAAAAPALPAAPAMPVTPAPN